MTAFVAMYYGASIGDARLVADVTTRLLRRADQLPYVGTPRGSAASLRATQRRPRGQPAGPDKAA